MSFSWFSHSLLSTSNRSSSSAFSLNQSLSLCSKRQRRSMAAECVSARILRCSSLSLRTVGVSLFDSRGLREAADPKPAADCAPPLAKLVASLASNCRRARSAEGTEERSQQGDGKERVGEVVLLQNILQFGAK